MKYFILCLLIANVLANKCGGNCLTGTCPSCPCGTVRTRVDVGEVCRRYSWNFKCCVCVVRTQSSGNASAQHFNHNGSFDVGLFQINEINWASCNDGRPPCDINSNLNCAITIYKRAHNRWNPWAAAAKKCGCWNSACFCTNPFTFTLEFQPL
eukprot:TRINITY_DN6154_c0_g1_i11.p1 TRINITY_DN6154_c0_g1~~TRINITY_DN6154_c0_g1_i11.p1  ORF type:complete len:153 (+),score=17.50 TRINITY_DN6154_c0_g1_i11:143-601(+)